MDVLLGLDFQSSMRQVSVPIKNHGDLRLPQGDLPSGSSPGLETPRHHGSTRATNIVDRESVTHSSTSERSTTNDPALQSDDIQAALTHDMTARVADYIDDDGVVFPVQDYVVVARR